MKTDNLEELMKHYGDFTDATISKIIFDQAENGLTTVLYLSSRLISIDKIQYDNIVLQLFDIEEIKFVQPFQSTNFRPWAGNFLKFSDKYIFDFCPVAENLTSIEEIVASNFYVICKSFLLESIPVVSILD